MAPGKRDKVKDRVKFYWTHHSVQIKGKEEESYLFAYEAVVSILAETGISVLQEVLNRKVKGTTTYKAGNFEGDDNHWTISFKGKEQVIKTTHMTCHAYPEKEGNFKLVKATLDTPAGYEKPDSNMKPSKFNRKWNKKDKKWEYGPGKPYWPTTAEGLHFGAERTMEELDDQIASRSTASQS